MKEREINEKISAWIGRPCTCETLDDRGSMYWGACAMHSMAGLPTPYVTSDRCAVELISELAQRGFKSILESCPSHHNLGGSIGYLFQISKGKWKYSCLQPTISEAICQALLRVIDSPKGESPFK
jgi:hypothetical protein